LVCTLSFQNRDVKARKGFFICARFIRSGAVAQFRAVWKAWALLDQGLLWSQPIDHIVVVARTRTLSSVIETVSITQVWIWERKPRVRLESN